MWTSTDFGTVMLKNFCLVLFILAIVFFVLEWIIQKMRHRVNSYEILYHWIALFPLGIGALYAAAFNSPQFRDVAASLAGFAPSPFQTIIAIANFSIGFVAICSIREGYGFRLSLVIASACWLWGNAIAIVYQKFLDGTLSAATLGSTFWLNALIPILLIICVRKLKFVSVSANPITK